MAKAIAVYTKLLSAKCQLAAMRNNYELKSGANKRLCVVCDTHGCDVWGKAHGLGLSELGKAPATYDYVYVEARTWGEARAMCHAILQQHNYQTAQTQLDEYGGVFNTRYPPQDAAESLDFASEIVGCVGAMQRAKQSAATALAMHVPKTARNPYTAMLKTASENICRAADAFTSATMLLYDAMKGLPSISTDCHIMPARGETLPPSFVHGKSDSVTTSYAELRLRDATPVSCNASISLHYPCVKHAPLFSRNVWAKLHIYVSISAQNITVAHFVQ